MGKQKIVASKIIILKVKKKSEQFGNIPIEVVKKKRFFTQW